MDGQPQHRAPARALEHTYGTVLKAEWDSRVGAASASKDTISTDEEDDEVNTD